LRHSAVLATVVVVIAALAAASASAAQLGVVGEMGSDQVSLINTATNKVVAKEIPAGEEPSSVAITPDGKYAYVADFKGDSVSVIEMGLRRNVATIEEVGEVANEAGESNESGQVGELEERVGELEEEVEGFSGLAQEVCSEESFIC